MPFEYDDELLDYFSSLDLGALPPAPQRDDPVALRAFTEASYRALDALSPQFKDVARTDFVAQSYDGASVALRWYTPADRDLSQPGSAVLYLHGGGMVALTLELYDATVAAYTADSRVPILAVDYRRAPEHVHPTPIEDCFAALAWLHERARELGVDPTRVAVMGDSAGGGLAAALGLMARERRFPLAKQILLCPMLDDRTTTPDPLLEPYAIWTYDQNYTCWHALLGDSFGGPDVPATAAPARARELSGLPDAYIEVGELDIFRAECIEFARRLWGAGVSTELHVHPGCPHGYHRARHAVDAARRSHADRMRVLRSL